MTAIRLIISIRKIAKISTLTENQPETPFSIYTDKMLLFRSLFMPARNYSCFLKALIVLAP